MQRRTFLVAFFTACVAVTLLAGIRSFSPAQGQIPLPSPAPVPTLPATGHYLGVGSCASPACHGGPDSAEPRSSLVGVGKQRGKWNSSYTVWVERDKHAKAYTVLYSDESKKILRNLDHLDAAADPMPYRDERCLACHATVAKSAASPQSPETKGNKRPQEGNLVTSEGVGCEACHGAARGWLAEHTVRTWSKTDPATHRDTHGLLAAAEAGKMVNTKDVKVRAQVCVDCHIGSAGDGGGPGRNMNHDMIAAGHPRLTFEYSTFLANMPPHWDEESTSGDGHPLRVWAVGQAVSTQAALRLLAARAKEAELNPAKAPWPEFSEYDCYTCHHATTPGSYHRKYMKPADKTGIRPGSYAWGRWYLPMTERLLGTGFDEHSDAQLEIHLKELNEFRRFMASPAPVPAHVAAKASAAAIGLEPLVSELDKPSLPPKVASRLFEGLKSEKESPANWDEACMIYLLYRNVYGGDSSLRPALLAVRKTLEFTAESASPGTEEPAYWNSPHDFDPERFRKAMNELRERLPSTGNGKENRP